MGTFINKNLSRRDFLKGSAAGVFGVAAAGAMGSTSMAGIVHAEEAVSYTPGTYSAVATGMGEVTVTVTFDETSITDVVLDLSNETADIGQAAGDALRQAILDGQTYNIDGVSGASLTSSAVKEAAANCIAQARGISVSALTEGTETEAETEEKELGEASTTYDTDVVIIGAGAAGLMAAYFLGQAGKNVIVIEKGSSTAVSNFALCGGPTACETTLQEEEDATVTLDEIYDYMYDYSRTSVNGRLLRKVLSHTGEAVNLMLDLGMPMMLMEDTYGVGFRGRHYFLTDGLERTQVLVDAIEEYDVTFLYQMEGKELIVSDGTVTGIKALDENKEVVAINAQAVLVCTGGFLGSTRMQMEHFNTPVFALGNTLSDGGGIEMVQNAGGVLDRNFAVLGNECGAVSAATTSWPFTDEWTNVNEHYGYWLFGGLYVDKSGERFINEDKIAQFPLAIGGEAILRTGKAYVIMDSDYYDACYTEGIYSYLGSPEEWVAGSEADYYNPTEENQAEHLEQAIEEGWAYKADTIEELAEYFGLNDLPETVETYNSYCESGTDEDFGKSSCFLKPVAAAPFYAFEYVPSAWGTNGGVKVDSHLRAVDSDNNAIPGLFVAGVDTGSMYCVPYYSNEGSSVGLALGSGVLAAYEIIDSLE